MVAHSLVELMVALALTLVVFGAAAGVAVQSMDGFLAVPEHADVVQRLRVAVDRIRADLGSAVAGAGSDADGAAAHAWPAVLPCGRGLDPVTGADGACARADAFSVVLAARPLRLRVRQVVGDPSSAVPVMFPPGCAAGVGGCRLSPGEPLVVADGYGRVDFGRVAATPAPADLLLHEPARSGPLPAGATVTFAAPRAYYATRDPSTGALQLRRRDGDADLPMVDHLARWQVEYFGSAGPPAVATDGDGHVRASYGPAPARLGAGPGEPPVYAASCAFVIQDGMPVSRFDMLPGAGTADVRLALERFRDGPWCPDDASPWRVDLDAFRITRIRLTVATQASGAAHRGADPAWFVRPGQALRAARRVPDVPAVVELAVAGGR